MNKLRRMWQTPHQRVAGLRTFVSRMSTTQDINDLPERFERILDLYDTAPLDPGFRNDVCQVLSGACLAAESMLDPAFDTERATDVISQHISILTHVLRFLASRPHRLGYSILYTANGTLVGQFNTRAEAEQQLETLKRIHYVTNAVVVPIKIISQFSIRPDVSPPLEGPLPNIIRPKPMSTSELDDVILEQNKLSPSVVEVSPLTSDRKDEPTGPKSTS